MKRKVYYVFLLFFAVGSLAAQSPVELITGKVFGLSEDSTFQPLYGASVHWLGTTHGTLTGTDGSFELSRSDVSQQVVISYVSYRDDTVSVGSQAFLEIYLSSALSLEEVEIKKRLGTTRISFIDPRKSELISEEELKKAACCNLSESFETSPSVDVSFTDAVTGTRQIQMLGLAGTYTQITTENMPDIRGLNAMTGLTYIPGTWVRSIQLNKGAGTVVNGFESISGQINAEYQRHSCEERLFVNGYANAEGRFELNAHVGSWVGDRFKTILLLHGSLNQMQMDHNSDGFMDMPLKKSFIGLNRWEMENDFNMHLEAGVKVTFEEKLGGEMFYRGNEFFAADSLWGMETSMRRIEGWTKTGYVHPVKVWQSTALQMKGAHHISDARFGLNYYSGEQSSFYANLMQKGRFAGPKHEYSAGLSLQYDQYSEMLNEQVYDYTEIVPGAYMEYTFKPGDRFSVVSGLRFDYHNHYGGFVTPRLHMRYEVSDQGVLRTSAGRGQRTSIVLAENLHLLASSRELVIENDPNLAGYGLKPEVAWNYGINYTHCFKLNYKEGSISFDFYRTDFENQVVVNLEDPRKAIISNLDGKSYANSFQTQLDYQLTKRLDMRVAYRFYDVKVTYGGELKQKPLLAPHRGFMNLAYATRNHWKFDATLNVQGEKRIPDLSSNPVEYQRPSTSPVFALINAQISKSWKERFDVYVGVENLLNYRQENPIIAADDPFGQYFDSSMIWGPIFGRKIYLGFRYTLGT